jgi:flagellar biosynthesis protein FliR
MKVSVIDLTQILTAGVSVGTRVSGMFVFTPFPGGVAVPARVKAGLTLAVTMLLFPSCGASAVVMDPGSLLFTLGSEMAIGAVLGLTVTFVFEAAQLAGHYAGLQVGFSLVNVIDPQTQVETPVLATLHQLLALLMFLQLNVHHWLLRGVAKSFAYIPSTSFVINGVLTDKLLQAAGAIFLAGIQIAAPILLATMATDIALGFISKASPQLQVLFLGFPIKTMLALAVWMGSLMYWPSRFESFFGNAIAVGERVLHLAS